MKFKYVGPNPVDEDGNKIPANCYMGNKLMHGDIVELFGHVEKKALNNPNYERVKPGPRPKTEELKKATD